MSQTKLELPDPPKSEPYNPVSEYLSLKASGLNCEEYKFFYGPMFLKPHEAEPATPHTSSSGIWFLAFLQLVTLVLVVQLWVHK